MNAKTAIQKMRNKYTCYIKLDVWTSESARRMQLECDEIANFIEQQEIKLQAEQQAHNEEKETSKCLSESLIFAHDKIIELDKTLKAEQDHHHLTLSALMDVMMAVKSDKSKNDIVKLFDQYVKEVEKGVE